MFNFDFNIFLAMVSFLLTILILLIYDLKKRVKFLEQKWGFSIKEITNIYQILAKESEVKYGQTQERTTQEGNRAFWGTSTNGKASRGGPGTSN